MNSEDRCELTVEMVCELNRAYLARRGSPAQALGLIEIALAWLYGRTGRLVDRAALQEKARAMEGSHPERWREIAARVQEVTGFRELKLEDLARQVGLEDNGPAAQAIRSGTYPFALLDVIRAARALNFNPDYLLGLTPVSFPVFDLFDQPVEGERR